MRIRRMLFAAGMMMALSAPNASAVSLLDLANGASIAALGGGVVFQNFEVTAKNGTDLSAIEVVATLGGWDILLGGQEKAKIELNYEAVASVPVAGANLGIDGTGEIKVESELEALNDQRKLKKVAKLKVQAGESDSDSFDPVAMLYVKTKVELKKPPVESVMAGFVLTGLSGSAAVVPEPGTALLLMAAAGGLAVVRRSRH